MIAPEPGDLICGTKSYFLLSRLLRLLDIGNGYFFFRFVYSLYILPGRPGLL